MEILVKGLATHPQCSLTRPLLYICETERCYHAASLVSTLQVTLKCLTLGEKYRKLSASQLHDYLPEGPLSWPVLY